MHRGSTRHSSILGRLVVVALVASLGLPISGCGKSDDKSEKEKQENLKSLLKKDAANI